MAAATRSSTTQAVRKAVHVLNCFAVAQSPTLGVTELSTMTGWTKSTISRLLAALEEGGLVRQDAVTARYSPGRQLVALAGAALSADGLYATCHPILAALAQSSGETANLSVVDVGQLLSIDEVPGSQPIKLSGWLGVRHPLHGSSSGKVLLAALAPKHLEAVLDAGLAPLTARTVTDRALLLDELAEVRARGYALNLEELIEGLTSAAAPVRDHTGVVVASISVAGPSFRLAGRHLEECITLASQAAAEASRELGYCGGAG